MDEKQLHKDISAVLNRHCCENTSNTPDWVLAHYLIDCLKAFDGATQLRESWYGRDPRPTEPGFIIQPTATPEPKDALDH